jgi:nucleoside-diphosphate-sugar epimerase
VPEVSVKNKDTLVIGDRGFIGQKVREKLCCDGIDRKNNISSEIIYNQTPIKGIKYIIFCAGQASVPYSKENPIGDLYLNTLSVLEMIELYPKAKFIFLSSINVLNPETPYAVSKLAAEQYVGILTHKPLILRLTNVIDKDHGLLAELEKADPIIVYGDRKKDFIHVNKVVNFIIGNYKYETGIQVVGSGKWTSIKSVAEKIAKRRNVKIIYKKLKELNV